MALSFQDKIQPVQTPAQGGDTSGLSFASKIRPVVSQDQKPILPKSELANGGVLGQESPIGISKGGMFGVGDVAGVVGDTLKGTASAMGAIPSEIQQAAQRGQETAAKGGIGNFFKGFVQQGLGGAGALARGILSPFSSLTGSIMNKTGASDALNEGVIKPLAGAVSNIPAVQNYAITHPNAEKDIQNATDIFNLAALKMTPQGEKIPTSPSEIIANTKEILPKIQEVPSKLQGKLQEKYINQALNDWKEPIKANETKFNKATDVYNNAQKSGHDIADTLVKNKIKLDNNIENGQYATAETADQIRADAGKTSHELLRPSLQQADYTTPKTPVSDIIKGTIEDIKNSKGLTPGNTEAQIAKATSEGEALARKYPDGMSLTDMHDNKITYASNGKYSPVGDVNVNNAAGVNRAFGRTMGHLVETKAPPELPVHKFNAELTKQYQVADYLDMLDKKKVPQSILSKIAKTTAKVIGAATGHGLGGGLLGGVGGYHIGGMVESMFENMPNPVKGYFLDSLSKTNPEAFNAVRNYLGEEQAAQLTRKAPPPGNQIPLGSRTPRVIRGRYEEPPKPIQRTINPKNMDILPRKK